MAAELLALQYKQCLYEPRFVRDLTVTAWTSNTLNVPLNWKQSESVNLLLHTEVHFSGDAIVKWRKKATNFIVTDYESWTEQKDSNEVICDLHLCLSHRAKLTPLTTLSPVVSLSQKRSVRLPDQPANDNSHKTKLCYNISYTFKENKDSGGFDKKSRVCCRERHWNSQFCTGSRMTSST